MQRLRIKIELLKLIAYKYWLFLLANIYAFWFKRKRERFNKIAAFWYNPTNIPGSTERIGYWKNYFDKDGFEFKNFTVVSIQEKIQKYEKVSWADKYKFLRNIYSKRWKQFKNLTDFDVVWIDRGYIPFDYDLKIAFFERAIKKMGLRLIIDSTDGGDYLSNPKLVTDTIKQADAITTAFKYIGQMYEKIVDIPIVYIAYTLPTEGYTLKNDFNIVEKPILGWMGSPGNMRYLKKIEKPLQKLASRLPFKIIVLCRDPLELNIPGAEIEYIRSFDNYKKLLSSFDIGICPFTVEDHSTKGKIAMKHQEFMICNVPQVCSPVSICEEVKNEEHAIIARQIDDWEEAVYKLIVNKELRKKIALNSNKLFHELFSYEKEYPKLKKVLVG